MTPSEVPGVVDVRLGHAQLAQCASQMQQRLAGCDVAEWLHIHAAFLEERPQNVYWTSLGRLLAPTGSAEYAAAGPVLAPAQL